MDWQALAQEVERGLDFLGDPEAAFIIAVRVEAQYGPAAYRATSPEAEEYAWEAFRFYLMARPTRRKPFMLSDEEADRVISLARSLVDRHRP